MPKQTRVQHMLPASLIEAVDALIKQGGEFASRSDLIRHLLREWVADKEANLKSDVEI